MSAIIEHVGEFAAAGALFGAVCTAPYVMSGRFQFRTLRNAAGLIVLAIIAFAITGILNWYIGGAWQWLAMFGLFALFISAGIRNVH